MKFALSQGTSEAGGTLLDYAQGAVRGGLKPGDAIAAISGWPASIVGLGKRVGTIAPGRDADLNVFSGDPLEPTSRLALVIIDGVVALPGAGTGARIQEDRPVRIPVPPSARLRSSRVRRGIVVRAGSPDQERQGDHVRGPRSREPRHSDRERQDHRDRDAAQRAVPRAHHRREGQGGDARLRPRAHDRGRRPHERADGRRPFVSVLDSIDPSRPFFDDCTRDGVYTLNIMPGDRTVVGGMGRIIRPVGRVVEEMTIVEAPGLKLSMIPAQGNRAAQLAKLRAALEDAQRHLEQKERDTDTRPTGNLTLDLEALSIERRKAALVRLLKREVPAFIACGEAGDVWRALELVKEFPIDVRLVLQPRCWRAAAMIAKAKVPAIVTPDFDVRGAGPGDGQARDPQPPEGPARGGSRVRGHGAPLDPRPAVHVVPGRGARALRHPARLRPQGRHPVRGPRDRPREDRRARSRSGRTAISSFSRRTRCPDSRGWRRA